MLSRRLRVEESQSGRIKKKKKKEKEKGKKKEKSLLQAAFRCLTLSLALRCIQLQWISNLVRSACSVLRLANKVEKLPEWEACVGGRQFIYRLYHRALASFVVFSSFFFLQRRLNLRDGIINFFPPSLPLIHHINSLSGPGRKRTNRHGRPPPPLPPAPR